MQRRYKRLTNEDRCQIQILLSMSFSQEGISKKIGKTQSTVSREIKRNSGHRSYCHQQAHRLAVRRQQAVRTKPITMASELVSKINNCLRKQWSPEQISGRFKLNGILVSHETIYRHIRQDKRAGGKIYPSRNKTRCQIMLMQLAHHP